MNVRRTWHDLVQKWVALLLAVFMLGAPLAQAAGPREQKTGGQLSESEMDALLRGALTSYKEDGDVQPEEQLSPDEIVRVVVELEEAPAAEGTEGDYDEAVKSRETQLLAAQSAVIAQIRALYPVTVVQQTAYLSNSITVEIARKAIEDIRTLKGVADAYEISKLEPEMYTAIDMAGATKVWEDYGYDGSGTLIAIIDSGVNYEHQDMTIDPGCGKYTREEMEEKIDLLGYGTYVNDKIPFAYSYVYGDNTILNDVNTHGYHVAGIAAANASDSGINGVASNAQILSMQVFDKVDGGSSSDWNFINSAIRRASAQGVVCCVSAGNSTMATISPETYDNGVPNGPVNDLGLVDTAIIASPSSAESALSVASVQNVGTLLSQATMETEGESRDMLCTDFFPAYDLSSLGEVRLYDMGTGDYTEYGSYDDNWEWVNKFTDEELAEMKGQIALVQRGDIEFTWKIYYAALYAGFGGVIIYDNSDSDVAPYGVGAQDYSQIPAIIVSGADSAYLKTLAESGQTVRFTGMEENIPAIVTEDVETSPFSSWGPTGSLDLKPEIAAPGGNIYSLAGGVDGYQTMSGTSMAAPYASGAEALLVQAIRARGMELSGQELTDFLKQNMMNTAEPVWDVAHNVPYSVRQQGAGLLNIEAAVGNLVTVTCDGEAKAALGQVGGQTSFDLTFTNYGQEAASYTLDATQVYQDYTEPETNLYYVQTMDGAAFSFDQDTVTVPAGGTATVRVTLTIPESAETEHFAEGYLKFTSQDGKADLGMPVLGFYGDWNKEPIVDAPYYSEDSFMRTTFLPEYREQYYGGSYYYRGYAGYSTCLVGLSGGTPDYALGEQIDPATRSMGASSAVRYIEPEYVSFSPNGDGLRDSIAPYLTFLRNAATVTMEILDADGNVIRNAGTMNEIRRLAYKDMSDANMAQFVSASNSLLVWDGTVYNMATGELEPVEAGQYTVRITTTTGVGDEVQTVELPVEVDLTSPTFDFCEVEEKDGAYYLHYRASDENGIHHLVAYGVNGSAGAWTDASFDYDESDGSFTVKLTGIQQNALNQCYIMVTDTAGNAAMEDFVFAVGEVQEPSGVTFTNLDIDAPVNYPQSSAVQSGLFEIYGTAEDGYEVEVAGRKAEILGNNFTVYVPLTEGDNMVTIVVRNPEGEEVLRRETNLFLDTVLPAVEFSIPEDLLLEQVNPYRFVTNQDQNAVIPLTVKVLDTSAGRCQWSYQYNVDESTTITQSDMFDVDENQEATIEFPLLNAMGLSITFSIYDKSGNLTMVSVSLYTQDYQENAHLNFSLKETNFGAYNIVNRELEDDTIVLTGYASHPVDLMWGETKVELEPGTGKFQIPVVLKEGLNTFHLYAVDNGVVVYDSYVKFQYQYNAPNLTLEVKPSQADGKIYTNETEFPIHGIFSDVTDSFTVYVNDQIIFASDNVQTPVEGSQAERTFDHTVTLQEGENIIWVEVYNVQNICTELYLHVVCDKEAPVLTDLFCTPYSISAATDATDVDHMEYSYDGENFQPYTDGAYLWPGKTIYVRVVDWAGNASNVCVTDVPEMVISVPTGTGSRPEQEETNFADVDSGAYYADAVKWAVEHDVTQGTSATTFSPDANCTRAETVTLLWRAMGSPEPTSQVNPFQDVEAGQYYYTALLWAVENGITTGTTATTFSPDNPVTRGEFVTFLYRAMGSGVSGAENPFQDVSAGAYYALPVAWAVENQITKGSSATTFSPELLCTRAQTVTFLYRAMAD